MIYITGDTHGDESRFIDNYMGDDSWGEDDYLIVCGDFGFIFHDNSREKQFLDYLESKPYTICFCDGNHENFSSIFSYSQEKWKGGNVHRIRKNVVHLMRGQVFEIDDRKIFTMGGAYTLDRARRKTGISYWKEELPVNREYNEAVENLRKHNNFVDIIITHTAPKEIILTMGRYPDLHDIELTGFLEWIMHEVDFTHWYFGHWHEDMEVTDKVTAVYLATHCL